MKHVHSFDIFVNEVRGINFKKLDNLEKAVLILWGKTLYMNIDSIPTKERPVSEAYELSHEIIKAHESGEWYDIDESEWWEEGAPFKDGSAIFSRGLIERTLKNIESPLTEDKTFYRYTTHKGKWKWVSVTENKGQYGGTETIINLSKGTPIINTQGLCDDGEWLLRTQIFNKFYKK
jgi:hypothetical protein